MKYFFDTEFIDNGWTIDLISVGIVSEDERELYLGNSECDMSKASQWVRDNVLIPMGVEFPSPTIPMRPIDPSFWHTKKRIAHEVVEFFCEKDYSPGQMPTPEIWADYASYDWVVFCQLWGTMMMDLPHFFPMYCHDIRQEWCRLGQPALPTQLGLRHSALEDARWNKIAYEHLQGLAQ